MNGALFLAACFALFLASKRQGFARAAFAVPALVWFGWAVFDVVTSAGGPMGLLR